MPKLAIPTNEALFPVPVVLVSCLDRAQDRANIITIAWCGVVSSTPPQLSISIRPPRHSHSLISSEREFVVNIPSAALAKKTDLCGVKSGRDTDKFSACSFTPIPASKVSAPLIQECPVNIECVLKQVVRLGSHDAFIGEVVQVHADEAVVDRNGAIDVGTVDPFVYNLGQYWDLGKKIGFYGFSSK